MCACMHKINVHIQSSYHLDISDVSYPPGSVLSVEKVANFLLPSLANGFDAHGNHTLQALEYLTGRFGPVASFTGTGKADRWRLTLNRQPQHPGTYTMSCYVVRLT